MELLIYTIYDRLAEECGPVFTAKNDAVAIRSYRIATKECYPGEHKLYRVGCVDTVKCMISAEDRPVEVVVPQLRKEE